MKLWLKRFFFIALLTAYFGALWYVSQNEPSNKDIQIQIQENDRKIDELKEQNRRLHEQLDKSDPDHDGVEGVDNHSGGAGASGSFNGAPTSAPRTTPTSQNTGNPGSNNGGTGNTGGGDTDEPEPGLLEELIGVPAPKL